MLRLPSQNFGLVTCIAFQNCRLSRLQCIASTLQDTMNNSKRRTDKQRSKVTAEPSGPDQTTTGTRHQARRVSNVGAFKPELAGMCGAYSRCAYSRGHTSAVYRVGLPSARTKAGARSYIRWCMPGSSGLRTCLDRARRALYNPLSSWGGAPGRRPVSSAWAAARAGAGYMPRRSPARGPPAARRSPAAHSATGRRAHTCRRRRRPPAAGRPRCAG